MGAILGAEMHEHASELPSRFPNPATRDASPVLDTSSHQAATSSQQPVVAQQRGRLGRASSEEYKDLGGGLGATHREDGVRIPA
jgi:hypothetical protein